MATGDDTGDMGDVQISARIPRDLFEALEGLAQVADRTVSAELRRAIREYVNKTKGEN